MSKIRNMGITDKWGFRHTCYIATAAQNLKDFKRLQFWSMDTSYGHIKKPDCVTLNVMKL